MELKTCKSCKKLFNYISGEQICSKCKQEAEEKFNEVKEYIRDNPSASLSRISEEMDVSVRQLQQWVREERLEFTSDSDIKFSCEMCGQTIRTGRFCEKCKGSLSQGFGAVYQNPAAAQAAKKGSERDRMHFLQN